jgi:putative SOS response-associated peptidase YedK
LVVNRSICPTFSRDEDSSMCGRYTMKSNPHAVAALCNLPSIPELKARFNIAPTQLVPVVRASAAGRELSMLRWGLIPSWAKDPKIAHTLINARSETAAEKPSFRTAFKRRRCLLPSDGFYEWEKVGKLKMPRHIRRRDEAPFAFAGLWECWRPPDGDPVETCTILTTTANEVTAPYHDRMPVILPPEHFDAWLAPGDADTAAFLPLLIPYSAAEMIAVPANPIVNSPKSDCPECLQVA